MRQGIDVSRWQGTINWAAVRQSGIEFAILKCGGSDAGFYRDKTFEENYRGAKANGVMVGVYYFVGEGCTSYEAGAADAKRCLEIIQGKQFEYPIYIDFEAPSGRDKVGNTEACIGFCETVERAGYFAGIYSSDISGFKDRLTAQRLTQFSWWVARYGSKPNRPNDPMHMWQKSSTGKVAGISGNVDLDESYVDFEKIVKERGLNGFVTAGEVVVNKKTLEERVSDLEVRVARLEK